MIVEENKKISKGFKHSQKHPYKYICLFTLLLYFFFYQFFGHYSNLICFVILITKTLK
jgi:hypothetical protein